MTLSWPRWLLAALALLALAGGVRAEVAVPPLQARVTDLTGTLSAEQKSKLEGELQAFEAKKGSQIAVLLVPTTAPETIEQYSIRVAEQWKLGRKGVDDGVLLLVAKHDRALRIEVGYGLEGVIPDAVAKRVVSDVIVPYFKQGDFAGGIEAGVDRLIRLVEGEPLPPPGRSGASGSSASGGVEDYLPLVFILVIIGGGLLRAILGPLLGASVAGGLSGLAGWLLFGSLVGGLLAGVLVFIFVLAGVSSGGGGFSSGGGGGFSGGGFSGGGGGFGGGGASGRW
jgi:uncharacterized protein